MNNDAHSQLAHVLPLRLLVGIFVALIALTIATVAVARVDLGDANIYVAMAVASIKALLVLLFFMHLKYEKPILAVVFGSTLFFVAIFLAFAMADTAAYAPEVQPLEQRLGNQ